MQTQTPNPERPRVPVSNQAANDLRAAATRLCPTCNASVSIHASICPVCGDGLPSRNRQIRCRRCGKKASSALVVCPHCGRELHPAPPRLFTWGAPLALVALFSVALFVQLGSVSPTRWILRQVDRATAFVSAIGEQLQPNLTVTLRPSAEEEGAELLSQPQIPPLSDALDQPEGSATQQGEFENTSFAQGNDEGTTSGNEAAVEAAETSSPAGEETPSETPTEAPTATPTDEPTPTTEPTFTPELTSTAVSANLTSTRVLTPTSSTPTVTSTLPAGNQFTVQPLVAASAATATATATQSITTTSTPFLALLLPTPTPPAPTPTPNIYIIRAGDTLFEIAMANGVSLSALLAANGLTEDDVYTIQPGDRIIIPDPNAPIESTATPTATPTPIQGGFTYTVQPGDTLMAIGMRFGVNLQRILDANNLTLAQARTLRPGQQLIIPGDAPPGSPTPTVVPVAPSPTPATAAASIRLDAPVLRTPENRVSVKCGAGEQLVWNPVASIQPTDLYLVHLGYVNGRTADGGEQIVWVIQQQRPANVTLWQLDDTLCGLAPLELGRQWRWYVEVVERGPDGTLRSVSPPSEMWGFTWQ
ncbi:MULTISPECIES: LysM peptidoglycan-binding domain-containing protein [Caldilinea]|uniref:LysM peptidoglycan-binding domain-containing protein n=1 Tax=Caldilinea TaxID=233191 RepID=UPI0002F9B4C5|nr:MULTISPECIES: LysM peptidoglycan-binding domain-containing protein [Caldilinea]GIV74818.1 MAG: hypothetical protein KatS3mg049_3374 [Caldilinea sp.]